MAKKIKIKVKKPKHSDAAVYFDTALQYYNSGDLGQAEMICRELLGACPDNAGAWHLSGLIERGKGRDDIASMYINRAVHINPHVAFYYYDLADILLDQGMADEAIKNYKKAIMLKPDYACAYNNLGLAFIEKAMPDEAIENYKRALTLNPNFFEACYNLGNAFADKGTLDEAINNYRRSLMLNPDYAEGYNNLGNALIDKGMLNEAMEVYKKAMVLKPDAEIHKNLGIAYLLEKDFEKGWEEREWRLNTILVPPLTKPKWEGDKLAGKKILVYAEQGLGDTIQFVRYLPKLYDDFSAGKVLFIPPEGLEQLLRESGLKAEILDATTPVETLEFDTNIHLLSLPRIFKTNLENIPFKGKRYLKASPEKVKWYREKFFNPTPYPLSPAPFKIGISWQGSRLFKRYKEKAILLKYLYPLCRLPDVQVYSLQKGYGIEQLKDIPEDLKIINLGETFNDFSDTAAAIENLDIVITIDTAVAHLSGALGKKTWILLPAYAEWRWHLDMDYSPWYEDVRLFRHKEPGKKDWEEMMERVVEELLKDRG